MTVPPPDAPERSASADSTTIERGLEILIAGLDPDMAVASRKYQQLRRKLVRLFEWRGAWTADDLADETLTRVARKLGEGARIDGDVEPFARGVARLVFLEFLREHDRDNRLRSSPPPASAPPADEIDLDCLDRCLAKIAATDRETILGYYADDATGRIEARRNLANRLGVSPTALRIRALRIRDRLETCLQECRAQRAEPR